MGPLPQSPVARKSWGGPVPSWLPERFNFRSILIEKDVEETVDEECGLSDDAIIDLIDLD